MSVFPFQALFKLIFTLSYLSVANAWPHCANRMVIERRLHSPPTLYWDSIALQVMLIEDLTQMTLNASVSHIHAPYLLF